MLGLQAKLWSITISVLAVSLTVLLAMWTTDRQSPVETRSVILSHDRLRPGESTKIQFTVIRNRVCDTLYQPMIIDGEGVRWPFEPFYLRLTPDQIGEDRYASEIVVPDKAAYGEARYRLIRRYYCNPLQRLLNWPIVSAYPDVVFQIVPP